MFESLENALISWNRRTSDRQKLQHTYMALLVVVVVLAGIFSLFSSTRSTLLLYIAIVLLTGLLANFLIWSLLKSSLLDRLPRQPRRR